MSNMWRVIALFVVVIGASGILRATDLQAESKEAFDLRNQLLRLENEIRILEQEKDEIEAEVLKPGSILLDVRLIDPAIRDASELKRTWPSRAMAEQSPNRRDANSRISADGLWSSSRARSCNASSRITS